MPGDPRCRHCSTPARQPDLKEERKGPRVGAPEGAISGFLKAAGLSSISEAVVQKDPKKGDFYIALTEKPGRAADDGSSTVKSGGDTMKPGRAADEPAPADGKKKKSKKKKSTEPAPK